MGKKKKNLLLVGVCLSAVLCLLAYTAKPGTSASSYSVTWHLRYSSSSSSCLYVYCLSYIVSPFYLSFTCPVTFAPFFFLISNSKGIFLFGHRYSLDFVQTLSSIKKKCANWLWKRENVKFIVYTKIKVSLELSLAGRIFSPLKLAFRHTQTFQCHSSPSSRSYYIFLTRHPAVYTDFDTLSFIESQNIRNLFNWRPFRL